MGTVTPIAVIYIFDWILYIILIYIIIKKSRKTDSNKEKRKQIRRQLISAMSLAVLFGLGWGVGFAATEGVPAALRLPLSIVFIFLTAFQGLFIFLFQVVYSKAVREVWKNSITPRMRSKTVSIGATSSEARFNTATKSLKHLSEQPLFYTNPSIEMKTFDIGENHLCTFVVKTDVIVAPVSLLLQILRRLPRLFYNLIKLFEYSSLHYISCVCLVSFHIVVILLQLLLLA